MDDTVKTVLFDVDGTLVDSNDSHARSWVDALREGGYEVPFEKIRPLIGAGSDKLVAALDIGITAGDEPGASIVARRKEIFLKKYLPHVRGFARSHDLIAALRDRGLTLVVASSASKEELEPLLRIAGAENSFDHATMPDDIEATKPDPDVVAAGVAWAGVTPAQTVMVGDTRFDVEAATKAGVRSIALRCGGSAPGELSGANAVYESPEDLLHALGDGPLDAVFAGAPAR